MIWPTADDLINIHSVVIGKIGGLDGLRDRAGLEAAVSAPFQSFGGEDLYKSDLEKIARLGYGLAANHAFIDGNKREYTAYYEMALAHLNEGGWILADNTLWDGWVIDEKRQDAQTNGVRAFNDFVRNDERVEEVILPLRDGLTIIRKK